MRQLLFILTFFLWASIANAQTTVVQDEFTVGSTEDLLGHVPTTTGSAWVELENTSTTLARVYSATDNTTVVAALTNTRVIYGSKPDPTQADASITVDMNFATTSNTEGHGLVLRWADTSNYYGALISRGSTLKCTIFKVVAGTVTTLGTSAGVPDDPETIIFEVMGSNLKLKWNGVDQISVTDSAITAAGAAGIGWGDVDRRGSLDVTAALYFDNYLLEKFSAASSFIGQIY